MARHKLYDCWKCGQQYRHLRGLRFTDAWCDDCLARYTSWGALIAWIEKEYGA